jgi:hypothetical protein
MQWSLATQATRARFTKQLSLMKSPPLTPEGQYEHTGPAERAKRK